MRASYFEGPPRPLASGFDVTLRLRDTVLRGELCVPESSRAAVLVVSATGGGPRDPGARLLGAFVRDGGFAVLLLDLLSTREEQTAGGSGGPGLPVGTLSARLCDVIDAMAGTGASLGLPLGLVTMQTASAAGLMAAMLRTRRVGALVSLAGAPELAAAALSRVRAPVLLVVEDQRPGAVLAHHRGAVLRLGAQPKRLVLLPGTRDLFEEPRALELAGRLTRAWLVRHLRQLRYPRYPEEPPGR